MYDALLNDPGFPSIGMGLLDPRGSNVGPNGYFAFDNGPFTMQYGGVCYLFLRNFVSTAGSYAFRMLDLASQLVLPVNVSVTNNLQSYPALVYQYAGTAGQRLYFRGQGNNPGATGPCSMRTTA